ncbi:MAG TPA: hypothetical protein VH370_19540 [Humisphaera sp.]|jgi:hypothetical protein|nr:hypothetical protein [Humisphaera sp.]
MTRVIWIKYREIAEERGNPSTDLPSLRNAVASCPQDHEEEIISYLANSPCYSAMGKVVRDVLDPDSTVHLYPATMTDGLYLWPLELAYYVRKYHVRLPADFFQRMASLNWKPVAKEAINFNNLCAEVARARATG